MLTHLKISVCDQLAEVIEVLLVGGLVCDQVENNAKVSMAKFEFLFG